MIADGIESMHGVTHTIEQIRERGVPGFEVEVVGTDGGVDRRLPAAAELEVPFYEGMRLGVPGLPDMVETLAEGRYDLLHVTAPGPAGVAATLLSRVTGMPLVGSYHTELAAYAGLRSGDGGLELMAHAALGAFYGAPVARPLAEPGGGPLADPPRGRRRRGSAAGSAASTPPASIPRRPTGGLPRRAEGPLRRPADPREGGRPAGRELPAGAPRRPAPAPADRRRRARGGRAARAARRRATFLGWLEGEELARAYASADLFLFCSRTDTYGQVIVEAGASGLPVVAVAEGGPASLIENRHTGMLCRPDADHIAGVVLQLASSPLLRRHLGASAVRAARARSWERALEQLAAGYRRALDAAVPGAEQAPARAA